MQIAESSMADAVDLIQSARHRLRRQCQLHRCRTQERGQEVARNSHSAADRGQPSRWWWRLRVWRPRCRHSPFIDAPGGVQFIGQGGETLAAAGEQMNLTVDGQNVWLKASSGNGVFVSDASATNTGTGWINSGSVTNPQANPYLTGLSNAQYDIDFQVSGGATTYTVNGGPATPTSAARPSSSTACRSRSRGARQRRQVHSQSIAKNLSVFDALDSAIQALGASNLNNGQISQAVNKGIANMDAVLSTMQGRPIGRGRNAQPHGWHRKPHQRHQAGCANRALQCGRPRHD